MTPVAKRLAVVVPALLLGAALWWALQGLDPAPDDGGELPGGVVAEVVEPPLPVAPAGADTGATPAVPLDVRPPATADPAAPRPTRQRPVFARGRLLCATPLDFAALDVSLIDREGDDVARAEVAADGSFEVRHGEALAGGWGLSCDGGLVAAAGGPRRLLPAFVGPFPAHAPGRPPVECELTLRFPPRILGVVAAARNGRPLEDAEISVGSSLPAWAFDDDDADSDADGRYQLEVSEVPATGVLVWCRAWDYQAKVVGPFDLPESGDVVLNFMLEKVRPLKGDVRDLLTGEPLEGVEVTLGSSHMPFEDDEDWDFTDAKGRFALDPEDLPLEGAWIHAAGPDGYGPAAVRLSLPPGERVLLELPPRARLTGVVLDTAGRPLGQAEILVVFQASWFGLDAGMADDAVADDQGAFEVDLDVAMPEQSRLIVTAPGHLSFEGALIEVADYDGAAHAYRVEIRLEPELAPDP